ncbi:MAG TPA: type 1 glutamine amidotransferase [Myxococcales bacterium]|nr:type 1 glutamine amidotransferase [Myxococcales bacterium]
MKRVLVLQHEAFEGPGTLGEALSGCELRVVCTFAGDPVPARLAEDGLVVLGGGMGVYEADRHPHLREEMSLLQDAVRSGRPVLGICLGSQLLAAALGAQVAKAPRKEIGWFEVDLLPGATDDALFAGAPASFAAFHWHGDAFALPAGAVPLAATAMTPLQAFRAGPRAWGIQFHLETDRQVLEAMLTSGAEELRDTGADAARILARAAAELPRLRALALQVFARWAALL